jgi:hypothetical protein
LFQRPALAICLILAACARMAPCATVDTCAPYQTVTAGNYVVECDYWNMPKCPGTQCLSIDDQTGAFSVTQATYSCGYNVAAYPNILYGCAWNVCSPNCDLPAQISSLKCVNTSWSFVPTDTGAWDAAYDIWICPDHQCGSGGFNNGAEIMVWLDYRDVNGWQYDKGPVTIDGMTWELWVMDNNSPSKCQYVAYLAKTMTTSIKNLDLKGFFDDSQARGYIKPSWYLYAVEAGNEIHSGGIPFTSKSFSVSVNKPCGAKAVYTPLPTFTPTATVNATPEIIPTPPSNF